MKYIILIFLSLFIYTNKAKSTEPEVYIRPGVKFGYQFGENGGFVYGFELGLINYKNNVEIDNLGTQTYLFGLITSIEFCNGKKKAHLGLELSTNNFVLELGPSIYNNNGEIYFGLTCGVNSLLIVTPYIEYTNILSDNSLSFFQTGGFLKVPIPFGNRSIKFH